MEVLHSDKIKEFIDKNMTVQFCLYLNNTLQNLAFIKARFSKHVDKPSHSVSVLRTGTHECQIRSAP